MGKVRRMLHSVTLASDAPALYADKRAIESAETMHVHERNVRLEYTPDEFAAFMEAMHGIRPRPAHGGTDTETIYLDLADISSSPGVTPQRFDIEETEYPTLDDTTIHIHYRSLRLELTHQEWLQFAFGVRAALHAWDSGS